MAQESIALNTPHSLGDIHVHKSVFSSIAHHVIEEMEYVELVSSNRPFKSGIQTNIDETGALTLTIPVRIHYQANVSDVATSLQNKIFESISYMTDYQPEHIQIQVVGFTF